MRTQAKIHEVRIGASLYRVETWKDTRPELKDGFEWVAVGTRFSGWSMGARADALKEAREVLLKAHGKDGG